MVFDGELAAALHGLRAVACSPALRLAPCVAVRLDNAAAGAARRSRRPADVGRDYAVPALQLTNEIEEPPCLLASTRTASFEWIPGHTNCRGNAKPDLLAKLGAESEAPSPGGDEPRRRAGGPRPTCSGGFRRGTSPRKSELHNKSAWLATVAARTQHGDSAA